MKQKTQKKELRWLWAHSRPAAGGILLLTLLYCVIAANSVVYALLMKQLVDSAIQHEMPGFFRAGALYLALILVQAALTMASNLTEEKLRAKLERGLRGSVFQTLLGMEHRTFSAYPAGTLLSHIATDVDTIVNEMLALLPGLLSLLVRLCAIAALLIAWDGRFALVLLAGGCVLLLAAPLLRRRMKRLQRAVREENDGLWAFLDEMFRSVPILKAFCAQKRMEEQLEDRLRRLQQVRYRQVVFSNICNRGFNLAVNSSYLFGLIWCSIGLMQGTMTYGTLTAVLQLVAQLQVPFSQLSGYLPRYYAMCTAADRLMQLEQAPAEPRAAAEAPVDCAALYEELAAIRAEDLHFAYEQKPVYSGASLCIQKGETVAFMGSSGIGKSTFLKLLLALYQPTSGSIWLEGRDGTRTPVTVDTRPLFAAPRAPRSSSPPCRRGTIQFWVRAAKASPKGRCSGWPWRGPFTRTAPSYCWTKRPLRWTRRPRCSCWPICSGTPGARPSSSSPIGGRHSRSVRGCLRWRTASCVRARSERKRNEYERERAGGTAAVPAVRPISRRRCARGAAG